MYWVRYWHSHWDLLHDGVWFHYWIWDWYLLLVHNVDWFRYSDWDCKGYRICDVINGVIIDVTKESMNDITYDVIIDVINNVLSDITCI